LAVEEHFYLAWPLLVLRCKTRTLVIVLTLTIIEVVLVRWIVIGSGYGVGYFTLCRMDGLAAGSLLAVAYRSTNLDRLSKWARKASIVVIPVGLVSYALLSGSGQTSVQIFKGTVIAMVYSSFLIVAVTAPLGSNVNGVLTSQILRTFGKYSYGIYVLHPFVLNEIGALPIILPIVRLFIAIVATFGFAYISWHILELPFLRLKRHFEYSGSAS
jgi:peptidoglycan/LPS O-acetylase OafA/YrhL